MSLKDGTSRVFDILKLNHKIEFEPQLDQAESSLLQWFVW
jgi:hypothetical protein